VARNVWNLRRNLIEAGWKVRELSEIQEADCKWLFDTVRVYSTATNLTQLPDEADRTIVVSGTDPNTNDDLQFRVRTVDIANRETDNVKAHLHHKAWPLKSSVDAHLETPVPAQPKEEDVVRWLINLIAAATRATGVRVVYHNSDKSYLVAGYDENTEHPLARVRLTDSANAMSASKVKYALMRSGWPMVRKRKEPRGTAESIVINPDPQEVHDVVSTEPATPPLKCGRCGAELFGRFLEPTRTETGERVLRCGECQLTARRETVQRASKNIARNVRQLEKFKPTKPDEDDYEKELGPAWSSPTWEEPS
jgi:hypothetical protein